MNITTKLDIDDKAFYMRNATVDTAFITAINITVGACCNGQIEQIVGYEITPNAGHPEQSVLGFNDKNLFKPADELFASLLKVPSV